MTKRTFLAACLALAGCVGPREAELDREMDALIEQDKARSRLEQLQRIQDKWRADYDRCTALLTGLRIGTATLKDAFALPCREDKINTTEVVGRTEDQLVYSGLGYLYFTNGVLTGRQIVSYEPLP